LGKEYKILLISGPNTGGKTVTLKSIGLLTLMALSGLPIPAREESKIGMFTDILADIGDNQSLENSLSTFSSHITNIRQMLETGTGSSLILIDEIGAATDPEQGAGLGQAILEELARKKVTGVITTHYTALKIYAETHPLCRNASMEFDPRRHVPTYGFKEGLPGHSFAIEVASELGLQKSLIKRAKELAGNQNVELTEILKKLTIEKNQLGHQNYLYKLKTSLLDQKINEHQEKLDKIAKESKDIKKRSIREARDYLITLQNELRSEIKSIEKNPEPVKKKALKKVLKKTSELQSEIKEQEEELTDNVLVPVSDPQVGMKVWVKEFDDQGEIIEIKKDKVKIDINGFIFSTDLSRIFELDQNKKKPELQKKAYSIPKKQAKLELKLLGLRFEEALPELDSFIDDAWLSGLDFVRIVHGKGTGALRSKVRQYLKQNEKIKEFHTPPPVAGGDGVTVAVLKDK
jgi:DNA mismatch repair protein MutS2